jgi:hypothetical protein
MNTEYVIIPICIPENKDEFIKVSGIPFAIHTRDDETGRLIDTAQAEQDYIEKAANVYGWHGKGKLSYVYGFGTAGGIGDKKSATKANERLIDKLRGFKQHELMSSKY